MDFCEAVHLAVHEDHVPSNCFQASHGFVEQARGTQAREWGHCVTTEMLCVPYLTRPTIIFMHL
jgi:hypothetical protein